MLVNLGTLKNPPKKAGVVAPPATPPSLLSAGVATGGTTMVLTFTAPTPPMLPASAATGLTVTVNSSANTVQSTITTSSVITATMSSAIYAGQNVTLGYTPGNITDSVPTALAAISAVNVSNSSTVSLPTLLSAGIPSAGTTMVLLFNSAFPPMLPASAATGLTVSVNSSANTVQSTITTSSIITATMSSIIYAGQNVTLGYTPGNITDNNSGSLADISAVNVSNSSTQTASYVATKSISFFGSSYAMVGDKAAHDVGGAGTWSIWVKGTGLGNYGGIVQKGDGGVAPGYALLDAGDSADKIAIQMYQAANQKRYNVSTAAFDGAWHHIAFTFNSSVIVSYFDRTIDATVIKTVDQAVTTITNVVTGLRVGSQISSGVPATFYTGQACNFSLWSVALNSAAITALATAGKPADLSLHAQYGSSCISWYKLGDGDTVANSSILDSTANAFHLTPANMLAGNILTDAP